MKIARKAKDVSDIVGVKTSSETPTTPGTKLDSESKPEQTSPSKAPPAPAATGAGLAGNEDQNLGGNIIGPELAKSKLLKRAGKAQRQAKPEALTPCAKINLNCTLARRDAINAAAESLGLTTTAYLLLCEEQAVHQLAKYFTAYIETKDTMAAEKVNARLDRLEEIIKGLPGLR
jgi:hypothetical protein